MKEYFDKLLRLMYEKKASDLHIKSNAHPIFRVNERLIPFRDYEKHNPEQICKIAESVLGKKDFEKLQDEKEIDLAYSLSKTGRYRINMYYQRGSIVIAIRLITLTVPEFDNLSLPPVLKKLSDRQNGLILVTGTTGCGKSTTLASLINHINSTKNVNIISIEDPIEYLHQDKLSIINQREIGIDTKNFHTALRYLLRQDPDVILIGEIRDVESMEVALGAADTGHLVFSTLHTTDARQTIERIINFFPTESANNVRLHLSLNLVAVISQRLVVRKDGSGMIPAVEIMVNSSRIQKAIAENKLHQITAFIGEGAVYGMQTFNQSFYKLVKEGSIAEEVALSSSSVPEELRMQLRGIFPSASDNFTAKTITHAMAMQKKKKFR